MVAVHFNDCDDTIAGSGKFITAPITIQIRWQA